MSDNVRFYWRATGPGGKLSPEYDTRKEAKDWLRQMLSGAPITFKYSVKLYRAEKNPAVGGQGIVTSTTVVASHSAGNS